MSELASQRKCQYEHLSLVRTGSTAALLRYSTSLPGLRSLYLVTQSESAAATEVPLPWVMMRAPASTAFCTCTRLSCGLVLLSKGRISNFLPAAPPLALSSSARNWKVLRPTSPTVAPGPERGSM